MTTKQKTPKVKRPRGRPPTVREFFQRVLSEAEQLALPTAREATGLDEEIAVLRTKIRTLARQRRVRKPVKQGTGPETQEEQEAREKQLARERERIDKMREADMQLLIRSMDTLATMLSVKHRLDKKSQKELSESISALLQGFRNELGLGEDRNGSRN
jgi:hypothetical protein